MKKRWMISLLAVGALLLAACNTQPAASVPPTEATMPTQAPGAEMGGADMAPGQEGMTGNAPEGAEMGPGNNAAGMEDGHDETSPGAGMAGNGYEESGHNGDAPGQGGAGMGGGEHNDGGPGRGGSGMGGSGHNGGGPGMGGSPGGEHNDGSPGGEHNDVGADGEHGHAEAPPEYANLVNPYAGDPQAIQAGEVIYQAYCLTCHGPQGAGDGPAAAGLNPPPANLADAAMMTALSDGFLYWRINEGMMSAPSAMPAFGMMLDEAQIWQVIAYIRTFSAP